MKKLLSFIMCVCLVATMFVTIGVQASSNDISVEIDGSIIEFDVNPEIIDGRTMVPLRKIFEEIGALVKWNGDTRTISARKSSKTVTLTVDSAAMQLDKGKTDDEGNPIIETIELDVPAKIISGRTLVPVRAISESFGLDVDWDEENRKVIIISEEEKDNSWEENVGSINLSDMTYSGEGISINGNQIKITKGGDYSISGTLSDGNITVSAKERVKLRLKGANITSSNGPCIFFEKADKAYITISKNTENVLTSKKSDDGAIYSKENLEIKGSGTLYIESDEGHGIKASDNLTIEEGTITIKAQSDGIHINDTFKMKDGVLNIISIGDGIDCESIVNISGGEINIETNGTPIEKTTSAETPQNNVVARPMWDEKPDVEFEKSTKGINAEWMMVISGGKINVNSASHTIHCEDEIEINGGKLTLTSKYDKGISAHGNLTINGADTLIDVTKSTEGIESKNVLTINDGYINVVSSDDALNATGGSTGMMPMGGGFGGNRGDMTVGSGGNRNPQGKNPGTQRPQRGENGQLGGMNPNGGFNPSFQIPSDGSSPFPFEIPSDGSFRPSFQIPSDGSFRPSFQIPSDGSFDPSFGMGPNGNQGAPNGNRQPMGGGMGRNSKACIIINGGHIEALGEDDCIDANGNLVINGGVVKATNPTGAFTGNFGVLDADGQIEVKEEANIILASSSGRSFNIPQNNIIIYCENKHTSDDKITISDKSGNVIYEYAPKGSYQTVMVASENIKIGEKYTVSIGSETFETEIAAQSTTIGTPINGGGMGFGGRQPRK